MVKQKPKSIHDKLPTSMTEAIDKKCHAEIVLGSLDEQAKELRRKKRLWKNRYKMNLDAINRFAIEAREFLNKKV